MNSKRIRSVVTLLLIAAAVTMLAALIQTACAEDCSAAVDKAAVKKAKTYKKAANRIFTVKGAKYCFSKKKVKTGLQKVKKNYYFFNKSTGKMMKNTVEKKGSKYYYFAKDGKRYDHGYKNAGGKKANIAAGIVISGAKIKPTGEATTSELKKAYKYIINKVSYVPMLPPDDSKDGWYKQEAYNTAKKKRGICYGYAALTFATYKALGFKGSLLSGKCARSEGKDPADHAWVQADDNGNGILYDSVFDATRDKDFTFFNKSVVMMNSGEYSYEALHYMYFVENVCR